MCRGGLRCGVDVEGRKSGGVSRLSADNLAFEEEEAGGFGWAAGVGYIQVNGQ